LNLIEKPSRKCGILDLGGRQKTMKVTWHFPSSTTIGEIPSPVGLARSRLEEPGGAQSKMQQQRCRGERLWEM
jgi:hypothetical protein